MQSIVWVVLSVLSGLGGRADATKRRAATIVDRPAKQQKTREIDAAAFLSTTETTFLLEELRSAVAGDIPSELNDDGDDFILQRLELRSYYRYDQVFPTLKPGGLARFLGLSPCADDDWKKFISGNARLTVRKLIIDAMAGEYFPWARVTNVIDAQQFIEIVREWKEELFEQPLAETAMLLVRIYRRMSQWDENVAWRLFFGNLPVPSASLHPHNLLYSISHLKLQPNLLSLLLLVHVQSQPHFSNDMANLDLSSMLFVHELLALVMVPQLRGEQCASPVISHQITDVVTAVSQASSVSELVLIFFRMLALDPMGRELWQAIRRPQYGNGHLEAVLVPQTWRALTPSAAYFPAELLVLANLWPFVQQMDHRVFCRIANVRAVNLSKLIPHMPPQVFSSYVKPLGLLNAAAITPGQMQHYSLWGCSALEMHALSDATFVAVSAERLFVYFAFSEAPRLHPGQWKLLETETIKAFLEKSMTSEYIIYAGDPCKFWRNLVANKTSMGDDQWLFISNFREIWSK